jgi:TonB family protein
MVTAIRLSYGAIELKRVYRRHLLMGTGSAAILMAITVSTVWLLTGTAEIVTVPVAPPDTILIDLFRLPVIVRERPGNEAIGTKEKTPEFGKLLPVDDDALAEEDRGLPTQDQIKRYYDASGDGADGIGNNAIVVTPADDYIPPPETFVPVETNPVPVHEVTPEYPRLAREGGFSGVVTLQVYVDGNGVVRKVLVAACTRPGMGFEEAAIKAAYLGKWRPGIQNGNPIGVWISYKVRFELEE